MSCRETLSHCIISKSYDTLQQNAGSLTPKCANINKKYVVLNAYWKTLQSSCSRLLKIIDSQKSVDWIRMSRVAIKACTHCINCYCKIVSEFIYIWWTSEPLLLVNWYIYLRLLFSPEKGQTAMNMHLNCLYLKRKYCLNAIFHKFRSGGSSISLTVFLSINLIIVWSSFNFDHVKH